MSNKMFTACLTNRSNIHREWDIFKITQFYFLTFNVVLIFFSGRFSEIFYVVFESRFRYEFSNDILEELSSVDVKTSRFVIHFMILRRQEEEREVKSF